MISFKYYVEVILDIQGRLANQDRSLTNLSGNASMPGHTFDLESSDMERSAYTPFGSTIVDTAPIRRDKSVVTSTFEIIIGTRDSERRKGKRKLMDGAPEPDQQPQQQQQQYQAPELGKDWHDYNAYYDHQWYDQQYWDWYYQHQGYHVQQEGGAQDLSYDRPPPPPVPMPQTPDETQMTEKERIQRAEQRLLPSRPPGMENGGTDGTDATAPYLPGESDVPESAPTYQTATSSSNFPMPATSSSTQDRPRQMSLIPAYEPPQAGSSAAPAMGTDDKQEMRHQQLQNAASAPPADEGEEVGPSVSDDHNATAPTLTEVHGAPPNHAHDSHADAVASSDLPQYER
jgi:hypothetical protein